MSDYTDSIGYNNASNMSVQPGQSIDYPKQGTPMDPKDHPATNIPDATEHYDGYEIARQVNAGPKTNKGGYGYDSEGIDPLPNTDDNRFTASGRDEKIISAKRKLRDGMQ